MGRRNEDMIRILYIIPQLNIGGAELQLLKLIKGLDKNKYKIYLCNLDRTANALQLEFEDAGAEIIDISKEGKLDLSIIFKLRKFILKKNIEVVHSFLNNLWARIAVIGIKNNRPKIIISERSIDDWWKKWYHFKVDAILMKVTDYATCNSHEIKKFYEEKLGLVAVDKFMVIYNGIEIENYTTTKINREEVRQKLDIKQNEVVFGIIASLREVKDHMTLLKAICELKEEDLDFKVLIIGEGKLRCSIEEYVKRNKIDKYVKLLGNIRPITQIIHGIDVGVSTSIREGLSNSIIEFGICGKQVIATKVGGNEELIKEKVNGKLFEVGNYKELAEIMRSYIKGQETNVEDKFVCEFTKMFEMENMIKSYESLYR